MPITARIPIRRLSQSEFGDIAYEVMEHVFAIHNAIGRFFDERIHKPELAQRLREVCLEEPVEVYPFYWQKDGGQKNGDEGEKEKV